MLANLAQDAAWSSLRGWLIRTGRATSADFLEQGPSGNVSIDYSRMPPVDLIPPVRIDPAALEGE